MLRQTQNAGPTVSKPRKGKKRNTPIINAPKTPADTHHLSTNSEAAEAAPTKAVWTNADTLGLLQFLVDNKARAGDGGSYPMTVYNEAAIECNKILSHGAKKTGASCKNKFSTGLRPTFKVCLTIDACSGLGGFDTETGAHVTPESESVWADLVKKNPAVAPFKVQTQGMAFLG
ncbi:hypothetical protein F5880DRAFT_1492007 [Lentinula raphanica]|nr:hypothetical protein F5880DRAFT_1492007 [Lentinula raphanica]